MMHSCPVDLKSVNSTVVRLNAIQIAAVVATGLVTGWYWLFFLLAIDFALRISPKNGWSPIRQVSYQLFFALKLPERLTDRAPKRFAATLGLIFSLVTGVLVLAGLDVSSWIVGGLFLGCALLEAVADFCVGCVLYSWLLQTRIIRPRVIPEPV